MKTASSKLAKLLSSDLPGSVSSKNIVLFTHPHHLAHGLLLEKTAYAQSFYVWELIVPLLNPMRSLSLNYSHRISPSLDEKFLLTVVQGQETIASSAILNSFRSQASLKYSNDIHLNEFLGKFPIQTSEKRLNIILDYAVAQCFEGEVERGMELLRSVRTSHNQNDFEKTVSEQAAIYLDALASGDSREFLRLITHNEEDNIRRHFPEL